MARAEMLTAALDTLGHRLSDAQSLAASQCEPVSLDDKVTAGHPQHTDANAPLCSTPCASFAC